MKSELARCRVQLIPYDEGVPSAALPGGAFGRSSSLLRARSTIQSAKRSSMIITSLSVTTYEPEHISSSQVRVGKKEGRRPLMPREWLSYKR